MTLSCRALAFSVDNLLNSSSHKTRDSVTVDAALLHSTTAKDFSSNPGELGDASCQKYKIEAASPKPETTTDVISLRHGSKHLTNQKQATEADQTDVLPSLKDSEHASIKKYAKSIETEGEHVRLVEEYLWKRSYDVSVTSSRRVERCARSADKLFQNAEYFKEHAETNFQDIKQSINSESAVKAITKKVLKRSDKDNKLCRFFSTVSGTSKDEKKHSASHRNDAILPSRHLAASCFSHDEVNVCQHPGTLYVNDSSRSDRSIFAKLCHADLWTSFHRLGTEMIITKTGRRMFPPVKLSLSGLNPDKLYSVKIDFQQPETQKYRYIYHSSRWMVSGSGDVLTASQSHTIPEGPMNGQVLCSQILSFERLKLTNIEPAKSGQVSLISMQKFQPQVVIEEVITRGNSDASPRQRYIITFPQTTFMAVTAYQNHQITRLKIASNPFAKGFRDSVKTRIPFETITSPLLLLPSRTGLDFVPGVGASPLLPAYFQRDGLNVGIGKRHSEDQSELESSNPLKMMTLGDNNFETHSRHNYLSEAGYTDQPTFYSAPHKLYCVPAYSHEDYGNHHLQHLLALQHEQQHTVTSAGHSSRQSLLYQLPYPSSLLEQMISNTSQEVRPQIMPLTATVAGAQSNLLSMHLSRP